MNPPEIPGITWHLAEPDVRDRCALASACLAADGGLPLSAEDPFQRSLTQSLDSIRGIQARNDGGALIAFTLAGTRQTVAGAEQVTIGQVHPEHRLRGIGAFLMEWADSTSARSVIRTESLTDSANRLYERFAYVQEFAEDVMCREVRGQILLPSRPGGIRLKEWDGATADQFFAAYEASFRERPGYSARSRDEWIHWITGDEEFRPEQSFVALSGATPVGFIACARNWIDLVGVVPEWRGRGIGACLILHLLHLLGDSGERECWLNVNVNNPASEFYKRLGFRVYGRRARYVRQARAG